MYVVGCDGLGVGFGVVVVFYFGVVFIFGIELCVWLCVGVVVM